MAVKRDKLEKKGIKAKLKEAAKSPIMNQEVLKNIDLIEASGIENLDHLDPVNIAKFERTCIKSAEKIERMLDNVTKIKIHMKGVHQGGKQRKIEMDIKAISPTKTFAGHAVGWDVEKITNQCFQDIEKQLIHHFKSDTSYRKPYA